MKANAPERLYLSKTIYSTYLYQVPDPDDETAVEYTRTDAFIEKACDYISNNIDRYCYIGLSGDGNGDSLTNEAYISSKFIKDFKNYMKGEQNV